MSLDIRLSDYPIGALGAAILRYGVLRCRSLIQRDWSQKDSTSNEMRMHAMILLLLSTSMNDNADASLSVSIPDTS